MNVAHLRAAAACVQLVSFWFGGVCFWQVDQEGVVVHDVVDDVLLLSVFVSL